jgi:class 3 adenylate cyclase/DNA-binding MarR family transcriptional regulator
MSLGERRIVAVLHMDIAGYSRLMRADEPATLRIMRVLRDLAFNLIAQHRGAVANTAGDSILAAFPTATNGLACALQIQERALEVNAQLIEDRRANFRMGLHAGEVEEREGDLLGDAVNIAARIQATAREGTVHLSGLVHEMVRVGSSVEFEEQGPRYLKNIPEPVTIFRAVPRAAPANSLPNTHRDQEIHLARRFFDVVYDAIRQAEQEVGLDYLEAPVLATCEDRPGLGECEIAHWLGLPEERVGRLVQDLVARGLLERRRNADSEGLSLTVAGAETRSRLRPLAQAAQDGVMTSLSEDERILLRTLLGRVIAGNDALRSFGKD